MERALPSNNDQMNANETNWRRIAEDLETALVFVKCDLSEELMGRGITGEKWHSLIAAEKSIESFHAAAEEEGRRCDVPAFSRPPQALLDYCREMRIQASAMTPEQRESALKRALSLTRPATKKIHP